MSEVMGGLVALALLILVFLVFRAAVLWYWKIDKIEEHLSAIRKSLAKENKEHKEGAVENPDMWNV